MMNSRIILIISILGIFSLFFQNFSPLGDDKLTEDNIQLSENNTPLISLTLKKEKLSQRQNKRAPASIEENEN